MTKQKHTPGPWTTIEAKNFYLGYPGTVEIHAPDWDALAVVHVETNGKPSEEGEANARLITAAPDLLEVLRSLTAVARRYLPDYDEHPEIQAADAAIAKATGGSND